jgi:Gas vesicle synthesis protein GvpL/GvpF
MYCYGIVRTPAIAQLEKMPDGIEGTLRWVICGEVSALVEAGFDMKMTALSEANLLAAIVAHDRVLRSVFECMTVLPLRFGTEFTTELALAQYFKQNLSTYLQKLTALENKAEISLTLTAIAPPEMTMPEQLTGRAYFLAKKQQAQQISNWQADCDRIRQTAVVLLSQFGIQIRSKNPDSPGDTYVLLYDRSVPVERYCEQWRSLISTQTEGAWQYILGEPTPPYHFVGDL